MISGNNPSTHAAARVHKNGVNQNITGDGSGGGVTKLTFSTASFDTLGWFDDANDRLTVGVAGKYIVNGQIVYTTGLAANNLLLAIVRVNGVDALQSQLVSPGTADAAVAVTGLLTLAVNDYVELNGYKGGANSVLYGAATQTYFELAYLSP